MLTTPHSTFEAIDWNAFTDVVVDGHRALEPDAVDHPYYAIGVGA